MYRYKQQDKREFVKQKSSLNTSTRGKGCFINAYTSSRTYHQIPVHAKRRIRLDASEVLEGIK